MRSCNLLRHQLLILTEYARRRWGGWGIPLFSAWALTLALVSVARLLLLSKAVELTGSPIGSPGRIWLVAGLNTGFALAFSISAFGLWTRQNWGRILFICAIIGWAAFIIIALFVSAPAGPVSTFFYEGIRVAVGLTISIWYFNLPRIKQLFSRDEEQNTVNRN